MTNSRLRPSAWRWIAPITLAALLAATPTTSTASPSSVRPSQSTSEARLELVDQRLAVDPNGTIRLRYLLTGLSGDPLQLLAPPEPEPPEPPTTDPSGTIAEPTPEPPPDPPPELPALTIEVTNYAPLTDPADVALVVGSNVDPDTFRTITDAVDGVALDARPLLTPNDDGTVDVDIDIETDVIESIETRLKLEEPGIYPLRIQLLLGDPDDNTVIATAGTVIQ